jgi:hypothetical protein
MNNYNIISLKTLMFNYFLLNKIFKTLLILRRLCFKIALTELKRGKMDGIKRRGANATINHSSSIDHRRVQKSTTLNRRFVKRPVLSKTATARQVTQAAKQQQTTQQQAAQRATTQQLRKHSATRATAAKARVVTAKSQQQLIARQKRVRLQPISSAKNQQQQGIDRVSMQATRAIAQKQQEIVSLKNAQKQQSEYAQAA